MVSLTLCLPICGDGHIVWGESCDDGNAVDNIGCNSSCNGIIEGYKCSNSTIQPSVCDTICGDKLILWNENCDDGADKDNQGCEDGCKSGSNPYWEC